MTDSSSRASVFPKHWFSYWVATNFLNFSFSGAEALRTTEISARATTKQFG